MVTGAELISDGASMFGMTTLGGTRQMRSMTPADSPMSPGGDEGWGANTTSDVNISRVDAWGEDNYRD